MPRSPLYNYDKKHVAYTQNILNALDSCILDSCVMKIAYMVTDRAMVFYHYTQRVHFFLYSN